ncbi:MAG: magnesium transporter [Nanoarchaeota archaeon]
MNNEEELMRRKLIHSKDKKELFRDIPKKDQGKLMLSFSSKTQEHLLAKLSNEEIIAFLKFIDLDEATDILQKMSPKRGKEIIKYLEKDAKEKIEILLKFDSESAAGMMTLDYIQVDINSRLKDVMALADKHEKKTGKFPVILVVKNSKIFGELPVHRMRKIKTNGRIEKHVRPIPHVLYKVNSNELPHLLRKHSHDKLVVVDDDEEILGIIYAHDVLNLLNGSDNIRKFAGVNKEEDVYDGFLEKTKNRYKWLIVNLITAFLAASVVGLFEDTIATFTLLAVYMPIVAGMGGNAGTQTLAVFVRGIALKEIDLNKKSISAIANEVAAGAFNGLITGILAAVVALLWNKSIMLGVIIGLAMIINLVVAGFFGAIIPLTMEKLGKDPATSATIFITTATDILGFFAFLGLATLLL